MTLESAAITDFGAQTVADFVRLEHESLTFADVVAIYANDAALWDALYDFREQQAADNGALGVGA